MASKYFSLISEIFPDTRVVDTCFTNFYSPTTRSLCIASNRSLRFFSFENSLVLQAQVKLFGSLSKIESVKTTRNQTDKLLLLFANGNISVVRYNPLNGKNSVETVEIFDFRLTQSIEEFGLVINEDKNLLSFLEVDENSKLCLSIYGSEFFVLIDLKEDEKEVESKRKSEKTKFNWQNIFSNEEKKIDETKSESSIDTNEMINNPESTKNKENEEVGIQKERVFHLETLGLCINSLLDIKFLSSYSDAYPSLIILHRTRAATNNGRLLSVRFNCALSVYSLFEVSKPRKYLEQINFPHDALYLIPLDKTCLFVVCASSIITVDMMRPERNEAFFFSSLAHASVDKNTFRPNFAFIELGLNFLDSEFIKLEANVALLSLADGQIWCLDMLSPDGIVLKPIAPSVETVSLSVCTSNERTFVFLGAQCSDSLLLEVKKEKGNKPGSVIFKQDNRPKVSLENIISKDHLNVKFPTTFSEAEEKKEDVEYSFTTVDFLPSIHGAMEFEYGKIAESKKSQGLSEKEKVEKDAEELRKQNKISLAADIMKRFEQRTENQNDAGAVNLTQVQEKFYKYSAYLNGINENHLDGEKILAMPYGKESFGGINIFPLEGLSLDKKSARTWKLETPKSKLSLMGGNFPENSPSKFLQIFLSDFSRQGNRTSVLISIFTLSKDEFVFQFYNGKEYANFMMRDFSSAPVFERTPLGSFHDKNMLVLSRLTFASKPMFVQVTSESFNLLLAKSPFQLIRAVRFDHSEEIGFLNLRALRNKKLQAIDGKKIVFQGKEFVFIHFNNLEVKIVFRSVGTDLDLINSFDSVMSFDVKVMKNGNLNLFVAQYNFNLKYYVFKILSFENSLESHRILFQSNAALRNLPLSMLNLSDKSSQSGKKGKSLTPESKLFFDSESFVAEISVQYLETQSSGSEFELNLFILIRTSLDVLIIYKVNETDEGIKSLERVQFRNSTLSSCDETYEDKKRRRFCTFDNLNNCSGILINSHSAESKKSILIGSKGFIHRIPIFEVFPSQVFAASTFENSFYTLDFLGRFSKYDKFSRSNLVLNTPSQPFVKIPLQRTVYRLINAGIPNQPAFILLNNFQSKYYVTLKNFTPQLLSNVKPEKESELELLQYEQGVCINNVVLDLSPINKNFDPKNVKSLFAVGTSFVTPSDEDIPCRGRVLVFALSNEDRNIEVKYIVDNPQTRGPVSQVDSVSGKLVCSLGTFPSQIRIYKYDSKYDRLLPHTFFDSPFLTVSLDSVKNYLLVTDIYNPSELVSWNQTKVQFDQLAVAERGTRSVSPFTNEASNVVTASKLFLFEELNKRQMILGVITLESCGNLFIRCYNSGSPVYEELGDFNLGSKGLVIKQHKTRLGNEFVRISTLDGSNYGLLSIQEKTFRTLYTLQTVLSVVGTGRNAGLNHLEFVSAKYRKKQRKRVLDGRLIFGFLDLPFQEQKQLSEMIGMKTKSLINTLDKIQSDYLFFG
eukprot:snap_masked-scaffold_16-processed-gene-5.29-mRNA-1 protein AED:1.00 eAED:1.00 QI:0/0/0/0/1/1/2/0/1467